MDEDVLKVANGRVIRYCAGQSNELVVIVVGINKEIRVGVRSGQNVRLVGIGAPANRIVEGDDLFMGGDFCRGYFRCSIAPCMSMNLLQANMAEPSRLRSVVICLD